MSWKEVAHQEESTKEGALRGDEVQQLRRILRVIDVDEPSGTLRIETGRAKILVRPDGTIRIEGRDVTQMAHRTLSLNGAIIELN